MREKCYTNPLRGGASILWKGIRSLLVIAAVFGASSLFAAGTPKFPFPQNYKYPYGTMPSTFFNAQTKAMYEKSFIGKYYVESTDKTMARVKFIQDNELESTTVSEGIGYGMLITVYMAGCDATQPDREYNMFKRLWKYYQFNSNTHKIMNWKVDDFTGKVVGGLPENSNGATDAELDVAQALLMAYKQWGDKQFLDDAMMMINAIWDYEMDYKFILKPGDAFDNYKNPCYFVTNAMALFAKVDPNSTHKWNAAVDAMYDLTLKVQNKTTGLVPDWVNSDAGYSYISGVITDKFESYYLYDAIRVQWRMAQAYSWYGHDKARQVCDLATSWSNNLTGGSPWAMKDGYTLDGKEAWTTGVAFLADKGKYSNACFAGGFASGGMVDNKFQAYLNKGFEQTATDITGTTYFVETTQLLYSLFMGGNMPNFYDMLPEFSSAKTSADGKYVDVTFTKYLKTSTVAGSTAGWSVKSDFGKVTNAISSVSSVNDSIVRLTFTATDSIADEYQVVSYNGAAGLQSIEGSSLGQFATDPMVLQNTTLSNYQFITDMRTFKRPIIISATTNPEGTKVILFFDQDLNARSVRETYFTLTSGGAAKTISSFELLASDLKMLTLNIGGASFTDYIQEGDKVLLTYSSTGRVASTNSQRLKPFTDRVVKNNTVLVKCTEIDDFESSATVQPLGKWTAPWDATEKWDVLFANPLATSAVNPSPNVLKYVRTVGSKGESAPLFTFTDPINPILKGGQYEFKFQVYSPNAAGSTVKFHLHNTADGTKIYDPGYNLELLYVIPATAKTGWVDATINLENEKDYKVILNEFEMSIDKSASVKGVGQEVYFDGFQLCSPKPVTELKSAFISTSGSQIVMKIGNEMKQPTDVSAFKVGRKGATSIDWVPAAEITSVAVDPTDPTKLILTYVSKFGSKDVVVISYSGTTAKSLDGRALTAFTEFPVVNAVNRVITTGWRDDFESTDDYVTYSLGDASGEYKLTENADKTLTVTGTKGTADYKSFGISLKDELWNLTNNQFVEFSVKTGQKVYIRVDLKDLVNDRIVDGVPVATVPASTAFQTVKYDFTGLWKNTYDPKGNIGPVDKTGIYEALIYIWSALPVAPDYTPTTFKGDVVFDYIAIGSSINVNLSKNTINEGATVTATCTDDATLYVVPNNTARDIAVLRDLVAAGKGYSLPMTKNAATTINAEKLKMGFYYIYAYQAVTGALSIKQTLDVKDVTPPVLTASFPTSTRIYDLNSFAQVSLNEDGYIMMVPGSLDLSTVSGASLRAATYLPKLAVAGQVDGFELSKLSTTAGFKLVAIDKSNLISAPSAIFTVVDNKPPVLQSVTAQVPVPKDVDGNTYYDDAVDKIDNIYFTATKKCAVYLVPEGTPKLEASITATGTSYDNTNVAAGVESYFTTQNIGEYYFEAVPRPTSGKFWLYAIDDNGNISDYAVVVVSNAVVTFKPITAISLSPAAGFAFTAIPSTGALSLLLTPTDGDISSVTWESMDKAVATVSGTNSSATVNAAGSGSTTIKVTVVDKSGNTLSKSVPVTVTLAIIPTVVTLTSPSTVALKPLESTVIAATVGLAGAPQDIVLTSTSTDVTISGTTVTAKTVTAATTAVIKVAAVGYPTVYKDVTITITPVVGVAVSITPSTAQALKVEQTAKLTATVQNYASDATVTWSSSNENVASVSSTGLVTALLPGTAVITATSNEVSTAKATVSVTVTKRAPKALALSETALNIVATSTDAKVIDVTFDPTDFPGEADLAITFVSSNTNVVATYNELTYKLTLTPKATATAGTTATVTVTSTANPALTATVVVTFVAIKVPLTAITASDLSLGVTQTGTLAFAYVPTTTTEPGVTFTSSNTSVIEVNPTTGEYEALAAGNATITIKSTANTAITKVVNVTVTAAKITAITVTNPASGSLNLNMVSAKTADITATFTPTYAVNDLVYTVTGTAGIVTVSSTGAVTATAIGTTEITVSSAATPSVKKVIPVTVSAGVTPVSSVAFETTAPTTVLQGGTLNLSSFVKVNPSTASNASVTWAVSSSQVTGSNGVYTVSSTATGTFTVTITSVDGGFQATRTITIQETAKPVSEVQVSASVSTVAPGGSVKLTATVVGGTDKSVTWESTPVGYTVAADGTVTFPAGMSSTAIKFRATSVEDKTIAGEVTVNVVKLSLTSISISSAVSVGVGSNTPLTAVLNPTEYVGDVVWTVSGSAVTINTSLGKSVTVTGVTAGQTATVTATADGKSSSCLVTVMSDFKKITDITVSTSAPTTMAAGATLNLGSYVSTTPLVTDEILTWSINVASSVATISQSGELVSKATTGSVIRVTVTNPDKSIVKTIDVTVQGASVPLTGISATLDGTVIDSLVVKKGLSVDKIGFTASNLNDATSTAVTYTVENSTVATVAVTNGVAKITALAPGRTTLTIKATVGTATKVIDVIVPMDAVALNKAIADINANATTIYSKLNATQKAEFSAAVALANKVSKAAKNNDFSKYSQTDVISSTAALNTYLNGVSDATVNVSIVMYPVPVKDVLFVTGTEVISISIADMNGTVVAEAKGAEVNTSALAAGEYVVTVVTTEGTIVEKVIK